MGKVRSNIVKRGGFTLVELLVALTILLILTGLALLFLPSMQDQERAARGAAQLQGWLNIAKMRALRDQSPRGLRLFLIDTSKVTDDQVLRKVGYKSGMWVVECQFIEQPPDLTGSTAPPRKVMPVNNNNAAVQLSGVSGFDAPQYPMDARIYPLSNLWPVQAGDYIVIPGETARKIDYPIALGPMTAVLPLSSDLPKDFKSSTSSFRIIRAPRVTGEEMLQLPQDVAIDITKNTTYALPDVTDAAGIGYDILFAPSGRVVSRNMTNFFLPLWVRDVNNDDPFSGEATIIAVHGFTGAVVAGPPNPPPGDPFAFVK